MTELEEILRKTDTEILQQKLRSSSYTDEAATLATKILLERNSEVPELLLSKKVSTDKSTGDRAPAFKLFAILATTFILLYAIGGTKSVERGVLKYIFTVLAIIVFWGLPWLFSKIPAVQRADAKIAQRKLIEKQHANYYGAEGDAAFKNGIARSMNPYRKNTDKTDKDFAGYWDRGYTAAKKIGERNN